MSQLEQLETQISPLIESQFPDFYKSDGPIFVAFVKKYIEWLESSQEIADYQNVYRGTVSVTSGNTTIIGNKTLFEDNIANGQSIAIYNGADHRLFTVNTISNNTVATLTTAPTFTNSNTTYAPTRLQYNPVYYARRGLQNQDIDETADEFLVFFKEKYLKNIQFDTETNVRLLAKKALDIYRAKGTEQAYDLLFRLAFGVPATIYYPSTDLFRLSDGEWKKPLYLEISLNNNAEKLVNKQIIGDDSGATAFVEALVRRTVAGRMIDVLYISALNGNFLTNEYINSIDNVLEVSEKPTVIGSLSSVELAAAGTGAGFYVGESVRIQSDLGEQATATVKSTANLSGVVDFELIDGGYGFSSYANVIISEKILKIANNDIDANNNLLNYYYPFEQIIQPLANIQYNNLVGGTFAAADTITTYYPNNQVKGTGLVLSVTASNSTAGYILSTIASGNLDATAFYGTSNTVYANTVAFVDRTVSANVVGYSGNVYINATNITGSFNVGETVYQVNAISDQTYAVATYVSKVSTGLTSANLFLSNVAGVFVDGQTIYGEISGTMATTGTTTDLSVGVIDESVYSFVSYSGNYVYGADSNTRGTITAIGTGSGASFGISNNFNYSEEVFLNADFLADFANVALNATVYGFAANGSANISTIIDDALTYENRTIGQIARLINVNPGTEYTNSPIIRVYDRYVAGYKRQDYSLRLSSSDGTFQPGELVTQAATDARGLVVTANSSEIILRRLRFNANNDFVITSNSTTTIYGTLSAATANLSAVYADLSSSYSGFNAIIDSDSTIANGAIVELQIDDAGFGYANNEDVIITSTNNATDGFGRAQLGTQGHSAGYYQQKGGFLSDQKKLLDSWYWQDLSYEVRSSVPLQKYQNMLKQLLHTAGTKYFGALIHKSHANNLVSSQSTTITVS